MAAATTEVHPGSSNRGSERTRRVRAMKPISPCIPASSQRSRLPVLSALAASATPTRSNPSARARLLRSAVNLFTGREYLNALGYAWGRRGDSGPSRILGDTPGRSLDRSRFCADIVGVTFVPIWWPVQRWQCSPFRSALPMQRLQACPRPTGSTRRSWRRSPGPCGDPLGTFRPDRPTRSRF